MNYLPAGAITVAVLSLGAPAGSAARILLGLAALMFLVVAWVDRRDQRSLHRAQGPGIR